MGDLNLFRIDQWNPRVPCTNADSAGRVSAIGAIEHAGFTDTWKALNSGEGWTGMRPLLQRIQNGDVDPSFVITHRMKLGDAPQGYEIFNNKDDDCLKVVLTP